jgi:uncharacterized phage protein gp47/JayE
MSYTAPAISSSGLSIPSYEDILGFYTQGFLSVYGQNSYLGDDSAPYQLMSIIALAAADTNAGLQQVFNNMSPAFAVGAGLDAIVAINGLTRKAATNSTCTVTLTGTPGAVITNGVIQNVVTGDLWNLPATVTIGGGGTVSVTATAQVAGAINATANQLTGIASPTAGWTSVTNGSNVAVLGDPVETDAQLRLRQQQSVALPSLTPLDATVAAIEATAGVTRNNVLENDTGTTDSYGNPGHSITCVVEGGMALAVATAIYNNRGLGVLTNGDVSGSPISQTQSVAVTSPNSGLVTTIGFIQPPVYVTIYVIVNAHLLPSGGSLSAAQVLAIQDAIIAYLEGLAIGGVVSFGDMILAAQTGAGAQISIRNPFYFEETSSPSTSTDIQLNFYQAAQCVVGNITVNSV